jgi:hypothetical protein
MDLAVGAASKSASLSAGPAILAAGVCSPSMERRPEDAFERVRFALERERRSGVDFPTAWRRAIDAAPPIAGHVRALSNAERTFNDEVWAIIWARDAWWAAYEGRPAPEPRYPCLALDDPVLAA